MTATNQQQTVAEAEVFVDLVLDDDDLMRAEFDALIGACWEAPSEPPRRKPSPPGGGWAGRPPHRWPPWQRSPLAGSVPARRPLSRERGPPLRPKR
ncbi:hypothetical protein E0H75_21100 [Kribbella capetownensis]|uniref:Uncharacterized protein n=1 Tax=Kribbella capetownensis TaxID=1572659 RepID=A0A4R0JRG1_9ACTN|nr:hypothetical protein [Kribbella capetownensis]TCC49047.1 hypothetical protein E0H75_21100 [Kribbella capetownensis]